MSVLKNSKHEIFCNEMANGRTAEDAYHVAYPNSSHLNGRRGSSGKLLQKIAIRDRIKELREKISDIANLTRARKEQLLSEIAEDSDNDEATRDRISAMKEHSAMLGHYAPKKLQVDGSGLILNLNMDSDKKKKK